MHILEWHLTGPGFNFQLKRISGAGLKKSPRYVSPALRQQAPYLPPSGLGSLHKVGRNAGRGVLLMMGGQGLRVFSTRTSGSMTSYNTIGEGGYSLPGQVFFTMKMVEIA
jgi:hypothetical protein